MREAKFKAWDRKNSRLLRVVSMKRICDYTNTWGWRVRVDYSRPVEPSDSVFYVPEVSEVSAQYELDPSECDLIQYIGRKDSEGNEIYSGDILHDKNTDELYEVVWDNALSMYVGYWLINKSYKPVQLHLLDYVTVVGNIYQNTELL